MEIRHEPENRRFVTGAGDTEAELTYARVGNTLVCHHTFVPAALRGGGIASALAHYALRYARDNGLEIRPACRFVAAYIRRHPEHQDLVAD